MTLLPLLAILVVLSAAPAAEAKGKAQVCGAGDCVTVTDPGTVGPLRSTFGSAPEPAPAPFYVVRFCSPEGCRPPFEWSYVYAPSPRTMRADDMGSGRVRWMRASVLSSLIADLTRGLAPYPASGSWTPTASKPAAHTVDTASAGAWLVLVPAALVALAAARRLRASG